MSNQEQIEAAAIGFARTKEYELTDSEIESILTELERGFGIEINEDGDEGVEEVKEIVREIVTEIVM